MLRVLYGYLMACSATDIPNLQFPRDEIIEIIPASYNNSAKHIHIPDLPQRLVPASPEDIRIPVPPSALPSGAVSPMSGLGTPAAPGTRTPETREGGGLELRKQALGAGLSVDPKAQT